MVRGVSVRIKQRHYGTTTERVSVFVNSDPTDDEEIRDRAIEAFLLALIDDIGDASESLALDPIRLSVSFLSQVVNLLDETAEDLPTSCIRLAKELQEAVRREYGSPAREPV